MICISFIFKGELYDAHKEIRVSRMTSKSNAETAEPEPNDFSYVTGPLHYGRKYAIKLVAVNANGISGNLKSHVISAFD